MSVSKQHIGAIRSPLNFIGKKLTFEKKEKQKELDE